MSTTTPSKRKTTTVPEFTVRGGSGIIAVTIPAQQVELEEYDGGAYRVHVRWPGGTDKQIGFIYREGTGWTATARVQDPSGGKMDGPVFKGDNFPTRTGKHTQRYALAFLLAIAAGLDRTAGVYGIRYEGVQA
jgi:hypothetical protein